MKILPHDHMLAKFSDVLDGFNLSPTPGTDGHVDDHRSLVQILLDVPHSNIAIGVGGKDPESGWMLNLSTDVEVPPTPTTWDEFREYAERPGVAVVAGNPHPLADGVTDYTEDSDEFDDMGVYIFASGVVGLSYAVADLIQQVTALKAA